MKCLTWTEEENALYAARKEDYDFVISNVADLVRAKSGISGAAEKNIKPIVEQTFDVIGRNIKKVVDAARSISELDSASFKFGTFVFFMAGQKLVAGCGMAGQKLVAGCGEENAKIAQDSCELLLEEKRFSALANYHLFRSGVNKITSLVFEKKTAHSANPLSVESIKFVPEFRQQKEACAIR